MTEIVASNDLDQLGPEQTSGAKAVHGPRALLLPGNARRSQSHRRRAKSRRAGLPAQVFWRSSASISAEPSLRLLRPRGRRPEPVALADHEGACTAPLRQLNALETLVLAAERLHDITVPILAKGRMETGRVWVYVRDDRPFGGTDPPAAWFYASRDRAREHPARHLAARSAFSIASILPTANPGPLVARCARAVPAANSSSWPTSPRTRDGGSRLRQSRRFAWEAVKRIDSLFDIERRINGLSGEAAGRAAGEEGRPG